jgi:hypothetical protein
MSEELHSRIEKQHLVTWFEFLLFQSFVMPSFCPSLCGVLHYDMPFPVIPLAQRVASFSSSQLLQSPCSTFLWPNVL